MSFPTQTVTERLNKAEMAESHKTELQRTGEMVSFSDTTGVRQQVDFTCPDAERLHRACAVTTATRRDSRQKRCTVIIIPGKSIAAARTVVFAILGGVFEERRFNDTWSLSRPASEAFLQLRLVLQDPIFLKGQR